jgi:hypothetical protein
MTLPKGWINRQFARVERDAEKWPEWMRRETELREREQKASAASDSREGNLETVKPATKKA